MSVFQLEYSMVEMNFFICNPTEIKRPHFVWMRTISHSNISVIQFNTKYLILIYQGYTLRFVYFFVDLILASLAVETTLSCFAPKKALPAAMNFYISVIWHLIQGFGMGLLVRFKTLVSFLLLLRIAPNVFDKVELYESEKKTTTKKKKYKNNALQYDGCSILALFCVENFGYFGWFG